MIEKMQWENEKELDILQKELSKKPTYKGKWIVISKSNEIDFEDNDEDFHQIKMSRQDNPNNRLLVPITSIVICHLKLPNGAIQVLKAMIDTRSSKSHLNISLVPP